MAGTSPTEWSAGPAPGERDALAELSVLLERERDAARAAMLSGLDSVRWERLAKGLAAMVQQGPARRSLATRAPAVIGMPELIEERHVAVAKAARRAKRSGVVSDFHRLRIRCKRLRYALEFSSEIYGGRTARYVRRLTALQDELGLMQDAEVASLRLADLATGKAGLSAATVFVIGGVAERHRHEVNRLLKRLPKELARVGGREWRDLARPHGATARRSRSRPATGAQHPAGTATSARRIGGGRRTRRRGGGTGPPGRAARVDRAVVNHPADRTIGARAGAARVRPRRLTGGPRAHQA